MFGRVNHNPFTRTQTLCRLMSSKDVEVRVGEPGCTPVTNGATIIIPPIPLCADEMEIALHEHAIAHEPAHITEGSFAVKNEVKSQLHHFIWNCVEDVRVENAQEQVKYPGLKLFRSKFYRDFQKYADRLNLNKMTAKNLVPALYGALTLLLLNARGKQLHEDVKIETSKRVDEIYGRVLADLVDDVAALTTLKQSFDIAGLIYERVRKMLKDDAEKKQREQAAKEKARQEKAAAKEKAQKEKAEKEAQKGEDSDDADGDEGDDDGEPKGKKSGSKSKKSEPKDDEGGDDSDGDVDDEPESKSGSKSKKSEPKDDEGEGDKDETDDAEPEDKKSGKSEKSETEDKDEGTDSDDGEPEDKDAEGETEPEDKAEGDETQPETEDKDEGDETETEPKDEAAEDDETETEGDGADTEDVPKNDKPEDKDAEGEESLTDEQQEAADNEAERLLKAIEDEEAQTVSDRIKQEIGGTGATNNVDDYPKKVTVLEHEAATPEYSANLAKEGVTLLGANGANMTRLMIANSRPRTLRNREHGKLDVRAVVSDDLDVRRDLWCLRKPGALAKAAVSILVDGSGSMVQYHSLKAHYSALVLHGVAHHLAAARVPFEVAYFDSDRILTATGTDYRALYHTVKSFNEPWHGKPFTRVWPRGGGGTPLELAMTEQAMRLLARPEDKKIAIVLTDGQPDRGVLPSMLVVEAMRGVGAVVVGIGIECDVSAVFGKDAVNLEPANLGEHLVNRLTEILNAHASERSETVARVR
jgi:hypothetical protein